jgi:hypothetical protein
VQPTKPGRCKPPTPGALLEHALEPPERPSSPARRQPCWDPPEPLWVVQHRCSTAATAGARTPWLGPALSCLSAFPRHRQPGLTSARHLILSSPYLALISPTPPPPRVCLEPPGHTHSQPLTSPLPSFLFLFFSPFAPARSRHAGCRSEQWMQRSACLDLTLPHERRTSTPSLPSLPTYRPSHLPCT